MSQDSRTVQSGPRLGAILKSASGVMAIITDRSSTGVLVRRSLPVAILGPPLFGWLGLVGERAGLYGAGFGAFLVAVANVSALTLTVWGIVRAFTRADVQRQSAEAALVKAEVFQRAIFQSPTFSSIATDARGVIQVFNVGAERMLGYSAAEVVDRITPADLSDADELVARAGALTAEFQTPISSGFDVLAFKAARGIEDIYELTYIRKDGQRVPAVVSVTVLRDASHTIIGYLLIGRDNTARKLVDDERLRLEQLLRDQNRELEEAGRALDAQFRHANKMDAIGQLAAGVAHDFNNLLTVILGFSELLASESKLTPDDLRDMTEIIKAARRAAELTKQLLAFSRQQPPNSTALDMNALVTDMTGMLDRLIGQHITVTLALAPELPEVIADRGQMEQVVMNLVVNARDAMEAGGSISIETTVIDMPDTLVGESVLPEGRYVRLAIADTGAGMTEETLAHLFDPFFTTKAVGKGTGLGLSTVAGIILQVKGHICVESVVGRGTTFTVYVPVSTQGTLELPVDVEAGVTASNAPVTILLVDDDAALRRLATRILPGAGYRVVEASNTHDAEQLFAHEAGRVALLVTDVMMPVVSGPDLWKRLRLTAPELPVVFMSSYLSAQRRQNLGVGGTFVQKPFSAADLARTVGTALGRSV